MDDAEELLRLIERAAEIDAEATARVMDNHLRASDQVIANAAALSVQNDPIGDLLGNPT